MTHPRIHIRSTPANDLYLFLSRLAPSNEIADLISDPGRLIRDRRGELRFLEQLTRGQGLPKQILQPPPTNSGVASPTCRGAADPGLRSNDTITTHVIRRRISILR